MPPPSFFRNREQPREDQEEQDKRKDPDDRVSHEQDQDNPKEHEPTPESLEFKLNLKEQYEQTIKSLKQAGIFEAIPENGNLCVKGVDGKNYSVPEYEDILKAVQEKEQALREKIEQGFTRLLLVPFATSLDILIAKYEQSILRHYQKGLLFGKNLKTGKAEPLELDVGDPVWFWNEPKADIQGRLIYEPRQFSRRHKGKTKQELIKELDSSCFPGWKVCLIQDSPIPREGKGKTIGRRHELEAGKSPEEYLSLLQGDPIYQNEQGVTYEDWLIYALNVLEERNEVIDDYQNKGSISYFIGSYFPSIREVTGARWDRARRRAGFIRAYPNSHDPAYGVRTLVKI